MNLNRYFFDIVARQWRKFVCMKKWWIIILGTFKIHNYCYNSLLSYCYVQIICFFPRGSNFVKSFLENTIIISKKLVSFVGLDFPEDLDLYLVFGYYYWCLLIFDDFISTLVLTLFTMVFAQYNFMSGSLRGSSDCYYDPGNLEYFHF